MRFSVLAVAATAISGVAGQRQCTYMEQCYNGTVAPACPSDGNLPLDCPALNGKTQRVTLGSQAWEFVPTCGLDYIDTFDIVALVTYTFADCLRACASYNRNHGRDECKALHFEAHDIFSTIRDNYGNCWLKNSTGKASTGSANTNAAARLSASFW